MPNDTILSQPELLVSTVRRASMRPPVAIGAGLALSLLSGGAEAIVTPFAHGVAPPEIAMTAQIEPVDVLNIQFDALADRWTVETTTESSDFMNVIMHWAYQRIIGLGPRAVPLILARLARTPDHWSWALRAITGENPVPPAAAGDMNAIAQAWLGWGRGRGLVA